MADAQRYVDIKALLDVAHPVSGVWNVDDALATDQMNLKDVPQETDEFPGVTVRDAATTLEYNALSDLLKDRWISFTSGSVIDLKAGGIDRQIVVSIFGGASDTVTALIALRDGLISLAEQDGLGTVSLGDIQSARAII